MLAIKRLTKSWARLLGFLVFCRYVVMLYPSGGGSRGGGIFVSPKIPLLLDRLAGNSPNSPKFRKHGAGPTEARRFELYWDHCLTTLAAVALPLSYTG